MTSSVALPVDLKACGANAAVGVQLGLSGYAGDRVGLSKGLDMK
jgi:hypothetical protein